MVAAPELGGAYRQAGDAPAADWLQNLGLGQYAQRFVENDIDFAILPDLTDQDLKELGLASLGHRRRLLRAIAQLSGGERTAKESVVESPTLPTPPIESAEHRPVTVVFSDIVGATTFSGMDPEDLRKIISAYEKCVAETVRRFGGFVAQFTGDGFLAYFGYPLAHEDDAERAVRAALELRTAVSNLRIQDALQIRVGIATGLYLAKTRGWLLCSTARAPCGPLVILKLPSRTRNLLLKKHGRPGRPRH
jgi:SAM domain (Sterile alpha motif)/Adenylate and Guanylate cyclase catalytic domain